MSSELRPSSKTRLNVRNFGLSGRYQLTYIRDLKVTKTFSGRSPYDFLSQGGRFDSFGNKSVSNLQLDGSIISVPKIDGRNPQPYRVTSLSGDYWAQDGVPTIGGRGVANYGDVGVFRLYQSGVYTRYDLSIAGAVGDERSCSHWRATATCGWYRGSYSSGSWRVWVNDAEEASVPIYFGDLDPGKSWIEDAERHKAVMESFLRTAASMASAIASAQVAQGKGLSYSSTIKYTSIENTAVSPAVAMRYLVDVARAAQSDPFGPYEKSRLAREAIEGLNSFDSNLLAYASDLRKTGDTVKSVLHLAQGIRSPKAWADAWLSGRYGDRLAVADTRELLTALGKQLKRSTASSTGRALTTTSSSITLHGVTYPLEAELLGVVIASNQSYSRLMTSIYNLMKWDAWPTLENTWDVIPLSFVVDWFLPVQDLLGQIDAAIEQPYVRPQSQYTGLKVKTNVALSSFPDVCLTGDVTATYYRRGPYNVLGDVRPFDVVTTIPSFSVTHSADAVALLVKTSKRA